MRPHVSGPLAPRSVSRWVRQLAVQLPPMLLYQCASGANDDYVWRLEHINLSPAIHDKRGASVDPDGSKYNNSDRQWHGVSYAKMCSNMIYLMESISSRNEGLQPPCRRRHTPASISTRPGTPRAPTPSAMAADNKRFAPWQCQSKYLVKDDTGNSAPAPGYTKDMGSDAKEYHRNQAMGSTWHIPTAVWLLFLLLLNLVEPAQALVPRPPKEFSLRARPHHHMVPTTQTPLFHPLHTLPANVVKEIQDSTLWIAWTPLRKIGSHTPSQAHPTRAPT